MKARGREPRVPGDVGNGAVAQHPAARCKSGAGEPCRRDADARTGQRTTDETAARKWTATELSAADSRHAQGAMPKTRAADPCHPEGAATAEGCAAPRKAYASAAPGKANVVGGHEFLGRDQRVEQRRVHRAEYGHALGRREEASSVLP